MHPVMQGYGEHMDDAEVAALATFLRKAWGNATGPVVAADVAKVRQHAAH